MEIRELEKGEGVAASRIYALSWKAAYRGIVPQDYLDQLPLDRWAPFLEDSPLDSFVLVEDDGALVATSSVGPARDEARDGWGEIVSIYVLPEHCHKGYGSALFSHVLEHLRKQGYEKLYLWVLAENHNARSFYEKHGFRPEDTMEMEIGGKLLTEVRYVLDGLN